MTAASSTYASGWGTGREGVVADDRCLLYVRERMGDGEGREGVVAD
jgi:hypothetical protein